jgi:hypothetical protein
MEKAVLTLPASRETGRVRKLGLVGKAVAAAAKSEKAAVKKCMMDDVVDDEDMDCSWCSREDMCLLLRST